VKAEKGKKGAENQVTQRGKKAKKKKETTCAGNPLLQRWLRETSCAETDNVKGKRKESRPKRKRMKS